jgi:hypothetical protein
MRDCTQQAATTPSPSTACRPHSTAAPPTMRYRPLTCPPPAASTPGLAAISTRAASPADAAAVRRKII